MKFKLLHTNDIHSNFENFAKIKTLIDLERDENTFVFDAGDFADFKRMELIATRGNLAGQLLKAAHYDGITVGNNETFQGIEMLEDMATNSSIPFLSCNMFKTDLSIKDVLPFIIIEKQGIKFLIIGTSPHLAIFPELMGFSYKDYSSEIKAIINNEAHDICILINHIGTKNDEVLANMIEGIDIIISSHDHKLYEKAIIINNTINHSAGQYGQHLGVIEFMYNNGQIELVNSKVLSIEGVESDNKILDIIRENHKLAVNILSQSLFSVNKTLYLDFIEECPIGNLLADALRDIFKSDIGLINSGIVNGGIKKGNVSELKLIDICPSPLNPTSFEILGKDLLIALEMSLEAIICLNDGKGPGFRGIALGRLHVSGMKIYYNNNHISEILVGDELLDIDKYYKVASSDYLQRNHIYTSLKNNINSIYNVEYFRDTLRVYLNKREFVEKAFVERWIEKK